MPPTVIVNNQTVVHRTAGGIAQVFPDVCRTPAPPSPAPAIIPFPNIAVSAHLSKGSTTVTCDGSPVMLRSSNFATSTGDEPGTLLGIGSNAVKGIAKPVLASMDVKFDGDNVVRRMDLVVQNGGAGTGNTAPVPVDVMPILAVGAAVVDPEVPKVTRLEWVPGDPIVCGDEIELRIATENFASRSTLPIRIPRMQPMPGARHRLQHDHGDTRIRGERGVLDWVSRQEDWAPEIDIVAEQITHDAVVQRSNKVKMRMVQDAKELVRGYRSVPQYRIRDTPTGKVLARVSPDYGWDFAYDIEIKGGVFTITRKMDFRTVFRVTRPGANPTTRDKHRWRSEVEAVWDRKWKIHRVACARGEQCNCEPDNGCCSFAIRIKWEDGPGHGTVELNAGANDPAGFKTPNWWYSDVWWMEIAGDLVAVRAHEFGHLIGMYDEYVQGGCYADPSGRRPYQNLPGSVMGGWQYTFAHHMTDFKEWFDKHATPVLGETELVRLHRW